MKEPGLTARIRAHLPARRIHLLAFLPLVGALLGGTLFLSPRLLSGTKAFALVDQTTLVVLKGQVDLQRSAGSRVRLSVTSDDTVVRPGDRVQTGPGDYAYLVYLDGSTTELDPNTSITLQRLDRRPDGALAFSFLQESGQTWNRVERLSHPGGSFQASALSASIEVRGAEFKLLAEPNQATIDAFTDSVTVASAGDSIDLGSGFRTIVREGEPPAPPRPIPPPPFAVRVDLDGPARPFLTDGHNRSVGFQPEAIAYGSQVPGATYRVAGSRRTCTFPTRPTRTTWS